MAYEHSQSTPVLVQALKRLCGENFAKRMGSGILVRLCDLDGKRLMDEFCIAAEDMEDIKGAIVQSIRSSLALRKSLRAAEIADIEKALA